MIVYLDNEFNPVSSAEKATLAKIRTGDGRIIFARPNGSPAVTKTDQFSLQNRPLTPAERRVDFAAIKSIYDNDAVKLGLALRDILKTMRQSTLDLIERQAQHGLTADFAQSIRLDAGPEFAQAVEAYLMDVWRRNRDLALAELPGELRDKIGPGLRAYHQPDNPEHDQESHGNWADGEKTNSRRPPWTLSSDEYEPEFFNVTFDSKQNRYLITKTSGPSSKVFIDVTTGNIYSGPTHGEISEAIYRVEKRRIPYVKDADISYRNGKYIDRSPERHEVDPYNLIIQHAILRGENIPKNILAAWRGSTRSKYEGYHLAGTPEDHNQDSHGNWADGIDTTDNSALVKRIREKGVPPGYAVRGVRQGGLVLGQGERGVWATNNLDHALSFGDKVELVKLPDKIFHGDLLATINKGKRKANRIDDVGDLTARDWRGLENYLRGQGFGGANFGPMHRDNADDLWIFDVKGRKQYASSFTPDVAGNYFRNRALLISGLIEDELVRQVKYEVFTHLLGGRTLNETMGRLREIFEPWVGDPSAIVPSGMSDTPEDLLQAYRLENIIRTESTLAVNQGRAAVADAATDFVLGYEYSAILDLRTTPEICAVIDGIKFRKDDRRVQALSPPTHFNCRSIVTFITTNDAPVNWSSEEVLDDAVRRVQPEFK